MITTRQGISHHWTRGLFLILAVVFLFGAVTGCGYRLAGGGTLPAGIHTVCVAIFENRSTETRLENQLVQELTYELSRNGQKVVSDPEKAQAVLSGVITSVSVETASYGSDRTSLESRIIMVASVALKTRNGDELWSVDRLIERQAFATSRDDSQAGSQNRQEALVLVSRRFAESVYARMTDDF